MSYSEAVGAIGSVAAELGFERVLSTETYTTFRGKDGWEISVTGRRPSEVNTVVQSPPNPDGSRRTYYLWILRQAFTGVSRLPDPVTDEEIAAFLRQAAPLIFTDPDAYDARYREANARINALAKERWGKEGE